MLEKAQNGGLFAATAAALGLSAAEVNTALASICPEVAARLHDRAAEDEDTYDTLLDLLDDNGGEVSLDDAEALTGAEAIADGNAVLDEIYGTRNAAVTAMRQLAPGIPESALPKLAAMGATAVLTALAQSRAAPVALAGAQAASDSGGGGLFGTIVAAVVKGLVEGAEKSLAPKRRRRRSYGSYFGRRRKTRTRTTRRRVQRTPLEEIFGEILGTRRR